MRNERERPHTSGKPPVSQNVLEGSRDAQAATRCERRVAVDALEVEELAKGERHEFPRQCAAAHLGGDFPRQHARRGSGEIDLAHLGAQYAVHERLPARHRLNLVEETVHRFGALLFGIEQVIRLEHGTGALVLQTAQAVVKEVDVQDVLARHAPIFELPDALEEERGLAAAPGTDADGGLARHHGHVKAARRAGRQVRLLEVEYDLSQGLCHISFFYCRFICKSI